MEGLAASNRLKVEIICESCGVRVLEADKMELQSQGADDYVRSEIFTFTNPYLGRPINGLRVECPYCGASLWGPLRRLWKTLQDEKLPKEWDE